MLSAPQLSAVGDAILMAAGYSASAATEAATLQDAHPITLLPITAREYIDRNRDELTRLWDRLTPLARANAIAAYEGRFQ